MPRPEDEPAEADADQIGERGEAEQLDEQRHAAVALVPAHRRNSGDRGDAVVEPGQPADSLALEVVRRPGEDRGARERIPVHADLDARDRRGADHRRRARLDMVEIGRAAAERAIAIQPAASATARPIRNLTKGDKRDLRG